MHTEIRSGQYCTALQKQTPFQEKDSQERWQEGHMAMTQKVSLTFVKQKVVKCLELARGRSRCGIRTVMFRA
uniref:Uncharacterized protein n=1 Tax=Helianthus annuus TaxID=4232 RepID=A0A251TE71_HELAN